MRKNKTGNLEVEEKMDGFVDGGKKNLGDFGEKEKSWGTVTVKKKLRDFGDKEKQIGKLRRSKQKIEGPWGRQKLGEFRDDEQWLRKTRKPYRLVIPCNWNLEISNIQGFDHLIPGEPK